MQVVETLLNNFQIQQRTKHFKKCLEICQLFFFMYRSDWQACRGVPIMSLKYSNIWWCSLKSTYLFCSFCLYNDVVNFWFFISTTLYIFHTLMPLWGLYNENIANFMYQVQINHMYRILFCFSHEKGHILCCVSCSWRAI